MVNGSRMESGGLGGEIRSGRQGRSGGRKRDGSNAGQGKRNTMTRDEKVKETEKEEEMTGGAGWEVDRDRRRPQQRFSSRHPGQSRCERREATPPKQINLP